MGAKRNPEQIRRSYLYLAAFSGVLVVLGFCVHLLLIEFIGAPLIGMGLSNYLRRT